MSRQTINPQRIYQDAVIAAQSVFAKQAQKQNQIRLLQTFGTDALNRHPAGKAFVPSPEIQAAHNLFLQTCKHRAPNRRKIQSRDGKIRANLGLELEMA
ncbi:MAG TPA: hypothetical protein V6C65_05745 [Allocoleopsis sp.]